MRTTTLAVLLLFLAGSALAQSSDTPRTEPVDASTSARVSDSDDRIRVMVLGRSGRGEFEGHFFGSYLLNAGYHGTILLTPVSPVIDIGLEAGASFMLPGVRPNPYLSVGPEIRYQQLLGDLHVKGVLVTAPEELSSEFVIGASGGYLFDPVGTSAELEAGLEYSLTGRDTWRYFIGAGIAFR